MSSQYGERRPINGWDRLASFGYPSTSKFQQASRLGFTSLLQRRHSVEVNHTLHHVWPSPALVHYIRFWGCCFPLMDFCQVQNSFCVQVLRYPILAALLHGTSAAWYLDVTGQPSHLTLSGWTEQRRQCGVLKIINPLHKSQYTYIFGRPSRLYLE